MYSKECDTAALSLVRKKKEAICCVSLGTVFRNSLMYKLTLIIHGAGLPACCTLPFCCESRGFRMMSSAQNCKVVALVRITYIFNRK